MSAGVATLLGISNQQIHGPIVLKEHAKHFESIDFCVPAVAKVNLWLAKDITVDFGMGSRLLPKPADETNGALPFIDLVAKIPFSSGKYQIPISVEIINLETAIRFNADLNELVEAT